MHLVQPHIESNGPIEAAAYMAQLQAAHDAIVERSVNWTHAVAGPSWGILRERETSNI